MAFLATLGCCRMQGFCSLLLLCCVDIAVQHYVAGDISRVVVNLCHNIIIICLQCFDTVGLAGRQEGRLAYRNTAPAIPMWFLGDLWGPE